MTFLRRAQGVDGSNVIINLNIAVGLSEQGELNEASKLLADLPQPFTVAEAKAALRTSRRVAVPLLELLDQRGATRRLPDSRRLIR